MRRRGGVAPARRLALARWVAAACASMTTMGCLYYDSRWAQQAEEKKHRNERLRPAALSHRAAPPAGARVAHVRAYATRAYSVETLDWEAQFEALLRDANAIVEPELGITLESGGASVFQPAADEADLGRVISELPEHDTGDGAEWVVAFVRATPRFATDFHTLGMGRHFSKYLVLRASSDPAEHDALAQALDDTSRADVERLYSQRKHHRMVTVFLHELGHTLGAPHRSATDTIMSPVYSTTETSFDDATRGLVRITVGHAFDGRWQDAASDVVAYLDRVPDGWVPSERDEMRRRLAPPAAPPPPAQAKVAAVRAPAAPSVPSLPPPTPKGLASLDAADRKVYDDALALAPTNPRDAWSTAAPLFETHPDVVPVQELRCRLAKARRFFAGVVEAHCARLAALEQASGAAR